MMRTSLRLAVALLFVAAIGLLAVAEGNGQADRRAAGAPQGRPLRGTQTGSATLRNTPPPAQEAAGVTRALVAEGSVLREWDDRLIARERARELRLRRRQADTLMPGRVHERLDQYYRGVPVFGGEAVRETGGGVTLSVTASIYSGVRIDTTPSLSGADAIRVFMRETGVRAGPAVAAQLMILPREDSSYALAYRVSAFTGNEMPVIFVNARTGGVELRYDDLKSQKATALMGTGVLGTEGLVANDLKKISCALQSSTYLAWDMMRPTTIKSYDLKGALTRAKSIFAGTAPLLQSDMATNTQATWADPVVVDAHTYLGWTYDYFYTRHGWKGLDGNNGRTVYLVVHSANRADYTKYSASDHVNLLHERLLLRILRLQPRGPVDVRRRAAGWLDHHVARRSDGGLRGGGPRRVAHEYTHGVTDYTSSLVYRNESGALSEAFSDIMSVGVEFYQQQAGGGLLQADYLEGEDVWRPSRPGSALRHPFVGPAGRLRQSGPLLEPLPRNGRQRRRSHELTDRKPRVLPGRRGREERDLRAFGDRRRRGEPRQGREGVLQGVHDTDRERDVQPGAREDDPGGARSLRRRQRGRDGHHPGVDRGGGVLGGGR